MRSSECSMTGPAPDPRDWPSAGGYLVDAGLVLDPRDVYHASAVSLAEQVQRELPSVHCVLLFGSGAVRSIGALPPADLDLMVMVDGAPSEADRAVARELGARYARRLELPIDLVVWPLAALRARAVDHLVVSLRSVRLCGLPIWDTPARIPASWDTAATRWRMDRDEARVTLAWLRRTVTELADSSGDSLAGDGLAGDGLAGDGLAGWVRRLQKRSLRLIGAVGLGLFGIFTTDLSRATELIACVRPDLAASAGAVLADHEAGDRSLDAAVRAVDLCVAVLAFDELVVGNANR